jgi:DNA-binding response OmpR family regulator
MARILIVEDEALIAELLAMYVEELGHEVVGPAATVDDALKIIETDPPAVAILDCSLAHQDSTPVAEALSKRKLPFAFATGRGADSLPQAFQDRPMIPKPYVFEDIERVLKQLIA